MLGNLAVLAAALGVFGTGTLWPDVIVAAAMAALALQGSVAVIRQSLDELNGATLKASHPKAIEYVTYLEGVEMAPSPAI